MNNTNKKLTAKNFDIESNIVECDVSYRGGTLKVNVSDMFPRLLNLRANDGYADIELIMGAYQNYLGGGIAGAIMGASMFNPDDLTKTEQKTYYALKERIKQYFYTLNAGGGDEYMVDNVNSYEKNQSSPVSGY